MSGKRTTELQRAINTLEAEKAAIQKSIDVLKAQQAAKPARTRKVKPIVMDGAQ